MKQLTVEKIENRAKDIIAARSKIYLFDYISKSKKIVLQECLEFGIPRSTFYEWKKKYELEGKDGLVQKKPMANNHPNKIRQPVIDKVLDLRENYQLGPIRISWYLIRYHGVNISESSVYRILRRNNCSRLPKSVSRRAIHTKRYSKTVPGHHVQVDVKFAFFQKIPDGKKINRY